MLKAFYRIESLSTSLFPQLSGGMKCRIDGGVCVRGAGRPGASIRAENVRGRARERGREIEIEGARGKRRQFGALCSLIAFNYTCPTLRSAAIATLYAGTAKLVPEVESFATLHSPPFDR